MGSIACLQISQLGLHTGHAYNPAICWIALQESLAIRLYEGLFTVPVRRDWEGGRDAGDWQVAVDLLRMLSKITQDVE